MTWTCLQCRRWVTGRQGDSRQEEWVQGKPSHGVLWQASSAQQVLAEKVQTRHQNYYFHSGFVTFLAIPGYKSPASVLLHPCLTVPGSSLLCRDCQPWKWERQWSCQLWGADSCVTQPAEKVTTPMEMMCLSHREKRMAHHRPFMRMQGMDRGRRSPSCTAQGGLEGGEIGQGLFACQDSCEEAGVSMKNKIGPPALLTKDEEAPSASCSKS